MCFVKCAFTSILYGAVWDWIKLAASVTQLYAIFARARYKNTLSAVCESLANEEKIPSSPESFSVSRGNAVVIVLANTRHVGKNKGNN